MLTAIVLSAPAYTYGHHSVVIGVLLSIPKVFGGEVVVCGPVPTRVIDPAC